MGNLQFTEALRSLIGFKIKIFSNDTTLYEGVLIDVKADFLIVKMSQEKEVFFYLDQIYAISKNAKDFKIQIPNSTHTQKQNLNGLLHDLKYNWVAVNSRNNQDFGGLLSKVTGDYIVLTNNEEQLYIRIPHISNISQGVFEEELPQNIVDEDIENTQSKEKENTQNKDKEKENTQSKEKENTQNKDKEKENTQNKDKEKENTQSKEKENTQNKDKEKENTQNKDKEKENTQNKDKEKENTQNKDKEKENTQNKENSRKEGIENIEQKKIEEVPDESYTSEDQKAEGNHLTEHAQQEEWTRFNHQKMLVHKPSRMKLRKMKKGQDNQKELTKTTLNNPFKEIKYSSPLIMKKMLPEIKMDPKTENEMLEQQYFALMMHAEKMYKKHKEIRLNS